jgi:hypothetical protein
LGGDQSEATGEEHAVTTDTQGHYTVPNLALGLYTLTAELHGFKQFVSKQNNLQANSTVELDGNLQVTRS